MLRDPVAADSSADDWTSPGSLHLAAVAAVAAAAGGGGGGAAAAEVVVA